MTESRHNRVARIFARASELPDAQREDYLANECQDDRALREEVDQLLLHASAGQTVFAASDGANRLKHISQSLTMPKQVGRYTPLRTLGDGGMAVVYLAQQQQPERQVALKMVKPGMDSVQILNRFDAERETLASMRHSGIATVFDAGIHDDGRSYFVMEHVEGSYITDYCRDHSLTIKERLELMVQVCDATVHAHQRGIIHRDLKPSNILIEGTGDERQPKIIDFGIARSVKSDGKNSDKLTQINQVVGTPDYMSPEQSISNADIDIRTDVYSLGVILHELLLGDLPAAPTTSSSRTGRPSYSGVTLASATRLRRAPADTLKRLAEERRSSASNLVTQVGGDLNWILNQALQPDRELRYASVTSLSNDVTRFLKGRAVHAHPPSRLYQLKYFLRRHAVGVAATSAVVLALAISTAGLAVGLNRADKAREEAELAKLAAVDAQHATERQIQRAKREARRASEVTEFMIELFDLSSPFKQTNTDLNARQLLERGVDTIQLKLHDQPVVRASMLESMARAHVNLGNYSAAEPIATEALLLAQQTKNDGDVQARIQTRRTRGLVHFYQGEYDQAQPLYEQALALYRQSPLDDTALEAELLHNLANAVFEQGENAEALNLFSQSLTLRTARQDGPDVKVAESLNSVGSAHRRVGNLDEALSYYQLALDMRLALDQKRHPDTAITLSNLGVTHFNLRRFNEAETYLLQALDIQHEAFDEDHPQVGTVLANLGATLAASKQLEKAKSTLEQSVAWHRATLGETHPNTANAMLNLGSVSQQLGELERSARLFRACIEIYTNSATKTPLTGVAMANLSETLLRQSKPKEALQFARVSSTQLTELLPAGHPWLAVASAALGAAEAANGNRAKGRELLFQSLPKLEATFGLDGTRTLSAKRYLEQLDTPE